MSFPLEIQQKCPFHWNSGTLPTLPALSACKIQQGIINNRQAAKNTLGDSCQTERLTSKTSARPLIFSLKCETRDDKSQGGLCCVELRDGKEARQRPSAAQVALAFSHLRKFPRTLRVRTTVCLMTLKVRKFQLDSFSAPCGISSGVSGGQLVGVSPGGSSLAPPLHSHVWSPAWLELLTRACLCGLMAQKPQGSQPRTWWLRAPRENVPRDLGEAAKLLMTSPQKF